MPGDFTWPLRKTEIISTKPFFRSRSKKENYERQLREIRQDYAREKKRMQQLRDFKTGNVRAASANRARDLLQGRSRVQDPDLNDRSQEEPVHQDKSTQGQKRNRLKEQNRMLLRQGRELQYERAALPREEHEGENQACKGDMNETIQTLDSNKL